MSSCFRAPEIHAVVIYLVHNITCIIIIVKLFSIISMIEGKCEFSHSAQRPNAHKTPHSRNNNRNFYYISWVFSSLLYTSKVNVMNTNTRNWWSRKMNGQNKIFNSQAVCQAVAHWKLYKQPTECHFDVISVTIKNLILLSMSFAVCQEQRSRAPK